MPTTRASYARVDWRYRDEPSAVPSQLVLQLPAELEPPLIKNRLIQPSLRRRAIGLRHGRHPQVLDAHYRVILADSVRDFMQIIAPRVGYANINALNSTFLLSPIVAVLGFSAQGPLGRRQRILVSPKAIDP